MKLLDTDHCIAILRGQLDLSVHVSPEEELATSSISVAELTHGAYRSRRQDDNLARLDVLLSVLIVLPFDDATGRRFGKIKAELEVRGEPLDNLDLQIACIAIENDCQLITNNGKHFSRIGELQLLNWLE